MKQANHILSQEEGTIVLFDSRTQHRVHKVRKGVRKSIVGWCVGPLGSEVDMAEQMTEEHVNFAERRQYWNLMDSHMIVLKKMVILL